jgi:hypothetical protein
MLSAGIGGIGLFKMSGLPLRAINWFPDQKLVANLILKVATLA